MEVENEQDASSVKTISIGASVNFPSSSYTNLIRPLEDGAARLEMVDDAKRGKSSGVVVPMPSVYPLLLDVTVRQYV